MEVAHGILIFLNLPYDLLFSSSNVRLGNLIPGDNSLFGTSLLLSRSIIGDIREHMPVAILD